MAAVASQNVLRLSRQHVTPLAGCYATQRRTEFTVVKPSDHTNLAAYRRGAGGRSSFSGVVATVFGATGFMGKAIVNRLGKIGSQVVCPYRGDGYFTKDLKLAGDLGQILFMPYDVRDEESIRKAVKYSNVVINLVSKRYETRHFSHELLNVETAGNIARISREMGVERLIHFSHLAASTEQQGVMIPGGSNFLATKQRGEDEVRKEFPDATIFRPSAIVGYDDSFTWYYLHESRRVGKHKTYMWNRGMDTTKAPVYVTDLATGVARAIQDSQSKGVTYEAYGPRAYYLGDIVNFILRENRDTHWTVKDMRYSPRMMLQAYFNEQYSRVPGFTFDSLEAELQSDIVTGGPSLEDLGVQLNAMEPVIHGNIRTYRQLTYQEDPLMQDTMEKEPDVFKNLHKTPMVQYD